MAKATRSYSAKAASAGKDIGKPGRTSPNRLQCKLKEYGSAAAGKRVAGAVLNKLTRRQINDDHLDAASADSTAGAF